MSSFKLRQGKALFRLLLKGGRDRSRVDARVDATCNGNTRVVIVRREESHALGVALVGGGEQPFFGLRIIAGAGWVDMAKEHGPNAGFGFGIAFLGRDHEIPPGGVVIPTIDSGDGRIGFGEKGGVEVGLRGMGLSGCRGSSLLRLWLWLSLGLNLWRRRLFPSPGERLPGGIGADDCVVIDEAVGSCIVGTGGVGYISAIRGRKGSVTGRAVARGNNEVIREPVGVVYRNHGDRLAVVRKGGLPSAVETRRIVGSLRAAGQPEEEG